MAEDKRSVNPMNARMKIMTNPGLLQKNFVRVFFRESMYGREPVRIKMVAVHGARGAWRTAR